MRKNPFLVTDRAVIRYLERRRGVDIEAIRDEIGELCRQGIERGACGVIAVDLEFRLEEGRVVTVLPASQPDVRTGRVRRKREIDR